MLSSAQAGTLAVDPSSGVAGLVSGNGGLTLGYEFQVSNPEGIVVDGLGFWDDQANGFFLGQTFDVGLWDPSNGNLLRESVVTSASPLRSSLNPGGGWRVNPIAPLYLTPGSYRIGALMPVSGANPKLRVAWDTGTTTRQGRQLGPRSCIISSRTWACAANGLLLPDYAMHQEIPYS